MLQLFRENAPNVRAEQRCIEYGAVVEVEPTLGVQTPFGPDLFVVIEKWESLQAHFKAPHMNAYAEKTRDLVTSRVIHILEPVLVSEPIRGDLFSHGIRKNWEISPRQICIPDLYPSARKLRKFGTESDHSFGNSIVL